MEICQNDLMGVSESNRNTWVAINLNIYKDLYEEYKAAGEKALAACAFSYIKILNSIIGMEYSQFHNYEKTMLWDAMELFSRQCEEQLKKAKECSNIENKKELINDIEKSIVKVFEVYRNIVDGTGEMNRQIIQNTSIDTSMYELSPKVSSYFSSILENLKRMIYDANQLEYAFILLPSLYSHIHTEVLLEKKESSGKVVIVYIPESAVDNFKLITVSLLHEGFHILTKAQRNRKARVIQFVQCVKICLSEKLFKNVFSENTIKANISKNWYKEIDDWQRRLLQESEDSKVFYGDRFQKEMVLKIHSCLKNINLQLQDKTLEIVKSNLRDRSYSEFEIKYHEISEIIKIVRKNIFELNKGEQISNIVAILMHLYKETYADMACILSLEILPDIYERAFHESISFRYDFDIYHGKVEQDIRAMLVADAVREHFVGEKKRAWDKYYANKLKNCEENMSKIAKEWKTSNELSYVKITFSNELSECFRTYLQKCSNDVNNLFRKINRLDSFRKEINCLLDAEVEGALLTILKGYSIKINREINE